MPIPYHSGPEGITINFLFFEFLCFRHKFRAYEETFLSFWVQKTTFKAQNGIGKCGIRTHDHFLSVLDLEKCDFQLQFSYTYQHMPEVLLLSRGSSESQLLWGIGLNFAKLC